MIVRTQQLKHDKQGDGNGGGGTGAGGDGKGGGATDDLLGTPQGGGSSSKGGQGTGGGAGTGGSPTGDQSNAGGAGGNAASDWKSSLNAELRENSSIGRYKSVEELANGYINLQRQFSGNKIVVPTDKSTPEEWQETFTKLGLPKEVKDYQVKFAEGATIDPKFTEDFKALAHKQGILPKQAQALADWFSEQNKGAETVYANEIKTARAAELKSLQTDWGDAYKQNLGVANMVFSELPEDLQKSIKESGLAGNVKLTRALAEIGKKYLSEDQIKGGAQGGGQQSFSPAEAKKAADAIMGDLKHPYHIKDHPAHGSAVKEVQALFAAMHPTTKNS